MPKVNLSLASAGYHLPEPGMPPPFHSQNLVRSLRLTQSSATSPGGRRPAPPAAATISAARIREIAGRILREAGGS